MKRRSRLLLASLLAAPVAGGLLLQAIARHQLSPDRLTLRLEATHNCRAEIESANVSLFSFPATVEIRNLRMVPRDAAAASATPPSQRTPLQVAETMIAADRLSLETNLWSLLTGNLSVRRIAVDRPDIRGVRGKKGEKSLDSLLAPPPASSPAAAAPPPAAASLAAETEPESDSAPSPAPPFKAANLPFAASLEEIRIRNGAYSLRNDRKRTFTEVRDFNAALTGVRIDPSNLASANEATLSAGGRIVIDNQQLSVRTLDLLLTLDGKIQPFDPATGELNGSTTLSCVARKGSSVNRIPTIVRLGERLDKLKSDIGLAIDLPSEGVLTRDTSLTATVRDRRLYLADDVLFLFDTYRIKLDRESWLALETEDHLFNGRLQGSTEVSRRALAGVTDFFRGKDPKLAEIVQKNVLSRIVTDKGLLSIPFESTGDIGKPDVDFSAKFRETLTGSMKDAAKDLLLDAASGGDALKGAVDTLLNGFLKKAIGKDKDKDKP
jgi:hypothetical protein